MNPDKFNKILAVDDSSANLRLLMNLLVEHGYAVYPASDGELALEFVQSTLPDLILLDIKMPGLDGYEVCRQLKADQRTASIPIVFLSALEDQRDKVKGFKAGGVDFITKPFQPEEMLARVSIHLRVKQLTEGLEQEVNARTEELLIANRQLQMEVTQRELTEEALKKERELFIAGPNMAYLLSAKDGWPLEYVSPNIQDQLGYDPVKIMRERTLAVELIHPDDIEKVKQEVEAHSKAGEPHFSLEFRVLTASGDSRWVSDFIVVRRDAHGEVTHYQGHFNDITERKLAEVALRESQLRLANILDNSPGAIYRCANDPDWTMEFISAGIERICGYPAEDFLNNRVRSFASIIHPDDLQRVADRRTHSLSKQDRYQLDYRLIAQDGSLRWVHEQGWGVFTDDGKSLYLDGTLFDITTQREAEETLKLNAERMQALLHLNQMTDASEDELMRFTYEAAIRLTRSKLGYLGLMNENETILNIQFWSQEAMDECRIPDMPLIFPVETSGLWGEAVRQRRPIVTNDYSAPNPWKRGMPEGHIKLIRHMNLPVIVGDKIVLLAGVGNKDEDYSASDEQQLSLLVEGMWRQIERLRAEDELRRYHAQLEDTVKQRTEELSISRDAAEAANKAKSAFLANMSHELRTPLNAILGFSSIIREDPQLPEGQRNNVNIINRSGEHLLTLINDVLEMAKIEAGGIKLGNAPFDLGGMVLDVIELMQMRARDKGLELVIDQSSQFPRYIVGDESRLRQVLINLIGNAIKYTDQGGVNLILGSRQNKHSHLIIVVEDSGPGIAVEDQKRIFDPFVQIGEKGDRKGTGLGLTISRQFVQMMNGSIELQSTPGKGSVFTIDLPLTDAMETDITQAEQQVANRVVGLAPGQPEYRILIVEDQIDNQLLLSSLLHHAGLQDKVAENGKQAVELYQSWQPHLIFMDRRMPVMDGEQATRQIRSLPNGDEVKIIAVTASAFKEQREQMLEAGVDDFIGKPYHPDEIYAQLSKHLEIRFLHDELVEAKQQRRALTPEMLSKLPDELRFDLQEAVESLEIQRIYYVIKQVDEYDHDLNKNLTQCVEDYDY
ncbi:MAG: response regulator, partial [Candidatus Thiodiazotropha sp. 6PLUC9]